MVQENYRLQLSKIYKEHFKYCDIDNFDPILIKFIKLAKIANNDQNSRNSYLSYQKTEKGKNAQNKQYQRRQNKSEKTNKSEKINKLIKKNDVICLLCNEEILSRFEIYTIEGKRPYCEKCYDKWAAKIKGE